MKTSTDDNLFLPDFCNVYTVFVGIVVTELLAFVLLLAPLSKSGYDWNYAKKDFINDLAMLSLFMQWVTLVSMGLLCLLRRWLCLLNSDIVAGILSYLLILMTTGVVSEFAWQLNEYMLSIAPASAAHHQLFLQARIRPHFLFNCMNTIASLIRFQPDKAEQVVLDFADLFRASLVDAKASVTFQEELALCRQYLCIEALRIGERLQVVWQLDNIPDDARLPPLCLQPLLENAIYHGIQPLLLRHFLPIKVIAWPNKIFTNVYRFFMALRRS